MNLAKVSSQRAVCEGPSGSVNGPILMLGAAAFSNRGTGCDSQLLREFRDPTVCSQTLSG